MPGFLHADYSPQEHEAMAAHEMTQERNNDDNSGGRSGWTNTSESPWRTCRPTFGESYAARREERR